MDNITLGQIASYVTLIGVIVGFFASINKWYKKKISDKMDDFEKRIKELEIENAFTKEESLILLKGQLACLKGLQELNCDGPVTQSISEIENYLLKQAHR